MDVRRQVGITLRRLRLERKISQETLAFEAKIARNYVSGIERGIENPTIVVLQRLARALGVPMAEIVSPGRPGETLLKNLPRGRNVHHRGRKSPKATR
ncbi:MAG TPA: helix-turn-helix transcriptional regulator [Rhizomicrobium sp.]